MNNCVLGNLEVENECTCNHVADYDIQCQRNVVRLVANRINNNNKNNKTRGLKHNFEKRMRENIRQNYIIVNEVKLWLVMSTQMAIEVTVTACTLETILES